MLSKYLLAACILLQITLVLSEDRTVLYVRDGPPRKSPWALRDPAPYNMRATFILSLFQRNVHLLEERFWENSDPKSPKFAQHMTHTEIKDLVSPSHSDQQRVLNWISRVAAANSLSGHLFDVQNAGDSIQVTASVQLTEILFQTKLFIFEHTKKGVMAMNHMGPFSIPTSLKSIIEMVTGITNFPPSPAPKLPNPTPKKARQGDDNQCNVPFSMKVLYGVPGDLQITNLKANASVYADEWGGPQEGFGSAALTYWEAANGYKSNPITCILGNRAKDIVPNDTDIEAHLDVQMVTGMAANAPTCFYIMSLANGWMYEFAALVFKTPGAPWIINLSSCGDETGECANQTQYGSGNCSTLHFPNWQTYLLRTNVEFMKLGLLGHTLVAASGDGGVAGCHYSNDGCATQAPQFPASSPYVTAVGATSVEVSTSAKAVDAPLPPICTDAQYGCQCSTSINEQVAQQINDAGFDTGGGFSFVFPQPTYQQKAVKAYLASSVTFPASNFWNSSNRGYPDMAAVGMNLCTLDAGSSCELEGGTSGSCPIVAGLFTLLNQDRLNAGKKPLGFMNKIIYDMFYESPSKYFNNQFLPATNAGECTGMGFASTPGIWSPLVGVGSPKFGAIRKYIAQLK